MATLFNNPAVKFNVLSGQINSYRATFEMKAGIPEAKVKRGLWLKMGTTGQLEEITGGLGSRSCYQLLEPKSQSDVTAFPYELDGTAHGGQMAVMTGSYIGEVGSDGWKSVLGDAAFAVGTPLKANDDGVLEPAASGDIISAYSLGVQENNMLKFDTHGANVEMP